MASSQQLPESDGKKVNVSQPALSQPPSTVAPPSTPVALSSPPPSSQMDQTTPPQPTIPPPVLASASRTNAAAAPDVPPRRNVSTQDSKKPPDESLKKRLSFDLQASQIISPEKSAGFTEIISAKEINSGSNESISIEFKRSVDRKATGYHAHTSLSNKGDDETEVNAEMSTALPLPQSVTSKTPSATKSLENKVSSRPPPETKGDKQWIRQLEEFAIKFFNKIFRRAAMERKMEAARKKLEAIANSQPNSQVPPGGGPIGDSNHNMEPVQSQEEEAALSSELNAMLDEIAESVTTVSPIYIAMITPIFSTLVELKCKSFRNTDNRCILGKVDDYQAFINCDSHSTLNSVVARVHTLVRFVNAIQIDSESLRKFPKMGGQQQGCPMKRKMGQEACCEESGDEEFLGDCPKHMLTPTQKSSGRPPWRIHIKVDEELMGRKEPRLCCPAAAKCIPKSSKSKGKRHANKGTTCNFNPFPKPFIPIQTAYMADPRIDATFFGPQGKANVIKFLCGQPCDHEDSCKPVWDRQAWSHADPSGPAKPAHRRQRPHPPAAQNQLSVPFQPQMDARSMSVSQPSSPGSGLHPSSSYNRSGRVTPCRSRSKTNRSKKIVNEPSAVIPDVQPSIVVMNLEPTETTPEIPAAAPRKMSFVPPPPEPEPAPTPQQSVGPSTEVIPRKLSLPPPPDPEPEPEQMAKPEPEPEPEPEVQPDPIPEPEPEPEPELTPEVEEPPPVADAEPQPEPELIAEELPEADPTPKESGVVPFEEPEPIEPEPEEEEMEQNEPIEPPPPSKPPSIAPVKEEIPPPPPEFRDDNDWIKKLEEFTVKFFNKIFRRSAIERKLKAAMKFPAACCQQGNTQALSDGGALGDSSFNKETVESQAEEAALAAELNAMLDEITQVITTVPPEYLPIITPAFRTFLDLKSKDFSKTDNRDILRKIDVFHAMIKCDSYSKENSTAVRVQNLINFINGIKTDSESLRKFPKITTKCCSTPSRVCHEIVEVFSGDEFQTVNIKMCKMKHKPQENPPLASNVNVADGKKEMPNCGQVADSCAPAEDTCKRSKRQRKKEANCNFSKSETLSFIPGCCPEVVGTSSCETEMRRRSLIRMAKTGKGCHQSVTVAPCKCGCCYDKDAEIPNICGILYTRYRANNPDPEDCPIEILGQGTGEVTFPSITNFRNIRVLNHDANRIPFSAAQPKCPVIPRSTDNCFGGKVNKKYPCGKKCCQDPCTPSYDPRSCFQRCPGSTRRPKRTCRSKGNARSVAAATNNCGTSTSDLRKTPKQAQVKQDQCGDLDPCREPWLDPCRGPGKC